MSTNRPQTLLEKWLEDVPNSNNVNVKKERKDFKDLFPPPAPFESSGSNATATATSNTVHQTSVTVGQQADTKASVPDEEENTIDSSSARGVFGWEKIHDIPLPVIMRENERLVAVRMVEMKVIGKFSSVLPWTVFSCINIRSYYVTDNEAKLLNEINSYHCDYHYGCDAFTTKDVVVCLQDVLTLYKFLETSKNIFTYGLAKSGIDWLGFVNISGSHLVPYIGKTCPLTSTVKKYVPQSFIQHRVLLVKVEKVEMSEWDESYFRMLYIYANMEHIQIPQNDSLCSLSELKWDSSLCPLHIEECSPPLTKLSTKMTSTKTEQQYIASSSSPYQSRCNAGSSMEDPNWLLVSNQSVSSSALRSLHQVSRVDINAIGFRAINLKPYSNQQAVFVSDIVTKMFRGVSVLTAHYILEKILQVKLHECTRLQEDSFVRSGARPLQGDKLVAVDVLKKCLPQLRQIILAGIGTGFSAPPPFTSHS